MSTDDERPAPLFHEVENRVREFTNYPDEETLYQLNITVQNAATVDADLAHAMWLEAVLQVLDNYGADNFDTDADDFDSDFAEDSNTLSVTALVQQQIDRKMIELVAKGPTKHERLSHALGDLFEYKIANEVPKMDGTGIDEHHLKRLLDQAKAVGARCNEIAIRQQLAQITYEIWWNQDTWRMSHLVNAHIPEQVATIWVIEGDAWLPYRDFHAVQDDLAVYLENEHHEVIRELQSRFEGFCTKPGEEVWSEWYPPDSPFHPDPLRLTIRRTENGILFTMQDLHYDGDDSGGNPITMERSGGLSDMRRFAIAMNRHEDLIYEQGPIVDLYLSPPRDALENMRRTIGTTQYTHLSTGSTSLITWPLSFQIDVSPLIHYFANALATTTHTARYSITGTDESTFVRAGDAQHTYTAVACPSWKAPLNPRFQSEAEQEITMGLLRLRIELPYGDNPEVTMRCALGLGVATKGHTFRRRHLGDPDWSIDLQDLKMTLREPLDHVSRQIIASLTQPARGTLSSPDPRRSPPDGSLGSRF